MKCSASRKRKKLPETGSLTTKTVPPAVSCRQMVKSLRSLGAEEIMRLPGIIIRYNIRGGCGKPRPPLYCSVKHQAFRSALTPGGWRGRLSALAFAAVMALVAMGLVALGAVALVALGAVGVVAATPARATRAAAATGWWSYAAGR